MTGHGPVLILGGTAEARALAARLHDLDVPFISSLAGRVQRPRLPVGDVRVGGFGGSTALRAWIVDHDCRAVIDATHPFAQQISRNAAEATAPISVPLIAFRRPQWVPTADDRWTIVDDIAAAATAVSGHGRRILLTTGRQDVTAFAADDSGHYVIRVVDPPTGDLPRHNRIIRSRGPYDLASELTLLRENDINTLVSKNSGGEHTRAKLIAARELGVRVVMVARPPSPTGVDLVDTLDEVVSRLLDRTAAR